MRIVLITALVALGLSACATRQQAATTTTGAVAGAVVGGPVGAVVGAGAGAVVGAPGGVIDEARPRRRVVRRTTVTRRPALVRTTRTTQVVR
jgi:uncharacterized membrane protein